MHKDAAKWLMTFTPISAFVTFALAFAPRAEAVVAMGFVPWVSAFPAAATALAVTLIATVVIIIQCSQVLLVEADTWTSLWNRDNWISRAFSEHGVGLPLFPASSDYVTAETKARSGAASAAEQNALAATSQRILTLSEAENARGRFKRFTCGYTICTVLIVAGMATSTVGLPANPDPVTKPTQVAIIMQPGTEAEFATASGCAALETTTAIAVGGLWDRPTLRLVGPECPDGDWAPPRDLPAAVVPK